MATVASAPRFVLNSERRFFSATAMAGLLVALIGFTPSWVLMRWFDSPPLPWIVHFHGALYLAWVLLYFAQTSLVAANRRDLHRTLGTGGALLGLAVIVMGVVISIEGARRGAGGPLRDQLAFLANPLTNIFTFTVLLGAAIAQRTRAAYHKRLMLLTMLPILTTPLARISMMLHVPLPGPVGGMLMADLFLLALAVYDRRKLGKLHPATIWGGAFLISTEVLRVLISQTRVWHDFAAALIG